MMRKWIASPPPPPGNLLYSWSRMKLWGETYHLFPEDLTLEHKVSTEPGSHPQNSNEAQGSTAFQQ